MRGPSCHGRTCTGCAVGGGQGEVLSFPSCTGHCQSPHCQASGLRADTDMTLPPPRREQPRSGAY